MKAVIEHSTLRQAMSNFKELGPSHYVSNFASALNRIYQTVGPLWAHQKPLTYEIQSELKADAGSVYTPVESPPQAPLNTLGLDLVFLGTYDNLFDHLSEKPIISRNSKQLRGF